METQSTWAIPLFFTRQRTLVVTISNFCLMADNSKQSQQN